MSDDKPVGISVQKMSVEVPISNNMYEEMLWMQKMQRFIHIRTGLIKSESAEEQAEYEQWELEQVAYEQQREELHRAGLLDDEGEQISPTTCPACVTIADSTAAGWNGPWGDSVRCERPRGHTGSHIYTMRWEDDERLNRD